jgi:AcrR family transcriptional regulator
MLRTVPSPSSREAILDAASEAILNGGARALRVAEVARRAGVSTPLLYYHFESRAALVRAALDHSAAVAPSAVLLAAGDGDSGLEAVRSGLMADLEDSPEVRRNTVIWNEVTALAAFEPELRDDVRRVTGGWQRAVASAIARGVADGSIAPHVDSDATAAVLTALIDGMSVRWLAGALELDDAREQLALALHALLSARAAV